MRKLIAMAVLGAGAILFSIAEPVQAMPIAASAGVAKQAAADNAVEQVHYRRYWKRWGHHRHWRPRYYGYYYRPYRYYQPYYYGYYPYYGYRHRPHFGVYLRF
jgi:hypothetical protein